MSVEYRMIDYPLVTFIVPTVGRATLRRALSSLLNQTDPYWRCIVEGDGVFPDASGLTDSRIAYYKEPHLAHESDMRNLGIARATTPWVAFLDDDDTVAPEYVEWMWNEEVERDVIIFRQTFPKDDGTTAVFPKDETIVWGNVGISYAVRTALAKECPFKRSRHEDLLQLTALEAGGAEIHWSPHIAYFARDHRA